MALVPSAATNRDANKAMRSTPGSQLDTKFEIQTYVAKSTAEDK